MRTKATSTFSSLFWQPKSLVSVYLGGLRLNRISVTSRHALSPSTSLCAPQISLLDQSGSTRNGSFFQIKIEFSGKNLSFLRISTRSFCLQVSIKMKEAHKFLKPLFFRLFEDHPRSLPEEEKKVDFKFITFLLFFVFWWNFVSKIMRWVRETKKNVLGYFPTHLIETLKNGPFLWRNLH